MAEAHHTPVSPPRRPYANAASVLPPELCREVCKHHHGILYVGRSPLDGEQRAALVVGLCREGTPHREIALAAGISVRRVQQILATARAKGSDLPRRERHNSQKERQSHETQDH